MSVILLEFDQFLRAIKARKSYTHSVLLGAGASKNSGIMTAAECIFDWKKEIYASKNLDLSNSDLEIKTPEDIQNWLVVQGEFPPAGHPDEYTFYAELTLTTEDARKAYFEDLFKDKTPSPGYLTLGRLIEKGLIKYVLTTNFDDLITKAAFQQNLVALEVNLDTTDNIYSQLNNKSFIKVALHGDYKFSKLKNTEKELDNQSEKLIDALKHYLTTNDLIVIGYSGRDKSLMEALEAAFKNDGRGCLYWVSYSDKVSSEVERLICSINTHKVRKAYQVKSENKDFDQVLGYLAKHCFRDDEDLISYLETIKTSNMPNKELVVTNYNDQLEMVASIETSSTSENQTKELQTIKLEIAPQIEKTLRDLVFGFLIGGWNENNSNDIELIEAILKKDYQSWIESIREVYETPNSPITLKNGVWATSNKLELLEFLSGRIYDNHLDSLESIATNVLGEINPELDLPQEDRYAAALYDKKLSYSESIREGIAESIALIGIDKNKLINCSTNYRNFIAPKIVRKLLLDTDWKLWGSLNSLIPTLAEAAPDEFMSCVENTLRRDDKPFESLFSQESNVFGGRIYTTGLLWALEGLAWSESYLARILLILAELASIDPGGNWKNRPINSLKTILLPWFPQTLANKDKRISAIKPVIRDFPDVAWRVILAMLPSQHETSSGSHKPKWRNPIPDDFKQEVLNIDYWDEVTQYANLAVDMAERDIAKLTQLAKEFDHLPVPAFERLNALLASETVRNLPEEEKAKVWENLIEFTQKHRRFPDAAWVLPNDILEKIETVTSQLAPTNLLLKYERLFGNNDWDLYDEEAPAEKNWEVQRQKLGEKRAKAIAEIYLAQGIDGIYKFINQVKSPNNVGIALADFNDGELTPNVIPKHINDESNQLKQFARGYAVEAFHKYGWNWVKAFDFTTWSINQKVELLTCLPFDIKTIAFVKELLGKKENLYWKLAFINAYHTDIDLLIVADKLLEVKRIHSAIDVLHHRFRDGKGLDIERSVKALLSINYSEDTSNQMSTYDTQELIKALQEDPNTPESDLFNVEWFYVPLLDELHGNKPVILQKKLATEPPFFAELMRLMYKPNDAGDDYPKPDEEKRNLATNAWRLLQNWKLPPGLKDGVFNATDFNDWVVAVKAQANEDKRYEITMQEIGKVFYYYPESDGGLWLPKEVAEVIDGKDAEDMRVGYALEIYNSRGVHTIDPEGKPEMALAAKWEARAVITENDSYPRFGAKLREVAESYRREAQRNIDEFANRR
jgi:SIR2-like domain